MTMEAYACYELKKPLNVTGILRRAETGDLEIIAEFFAGFSDGAYDVSVDPASQIPAAKRAIESGNLYTWIVDGTPVSMANIAHRSPRNARINAVYTPASLRKRGYASAIVAELCAILESERLIPMLYADSSNPDSNKVYQSIGFVKCGSIVDIKFGGD
jgi:predicted GNAT family acetyltransferase